MKVKSVPRASSINCYQGKWTARSQRLVDSADLIVSSIDLRKLVDSGKILLYYVDADDIPIGVFFARIDYTFDGLQELVIMFTIAETQTPIPFYSLLSPVYEQISEGRDIRIHSQHRVIDRFCESNGFEHFETVFIKRYRNGRKLKQ